VDLISGWIVAHSENGHLIRRFVSALLIAAVIASLPAGASGLSSLSVEAIVGPFPATIGSAGSEFKVEQSITFAVPPDRALHVLTGGDAEIAQAQIYPPLAGEVVMPSATYGEIT